MLRSIQDARRRFVVARYRWRHRFFHDYEFIHINKTAGSSIKYALGIPWERKHKTAQEKIDELGRRRWDRRFTFTVVRNPWDRVVSQYHYRIHSNQNELGESTVPFRDWVSKTFRENDPFYFDDPQMFMPQIDWIVDEDNNLLVEYVCRFERLRVDFEYVCRKIRSSADLPHRKASVRGPYREYYDEVTAEIVAGWFRKDIERFGYSF